MSRAAHWKTAEIDRLVLALRQGKTMAEAAMSVQRSAEACRLKAYAMNLAFEERRLSAKPSPVKYALITDAHDRRVMEQATRAHVAAVRRANPCGFAPNKIPLVSVKA